LFDLSREMGSPIKTVEFVNAPNMLKNTGFPKDYTAADFRRDQDIFHKWVRENDPECATIGPSDTDPNAMIVDADGKEPVLGENKELPAMTGVTAEGTLQVAPGGCTFFVLDA
jgi:hypothetical protein